MEEVKVNIIYNTAEHLNGYINISPFNSSENPDIVKGDVTTLDWMIDNGELTELIAMDTIEYLPINQYNAVISNWVSKLRVGGKLILGFTEVESICNLYNRGVIKHEDFNILIHGKQTDGRMVKLSSYSAPILIENLTKQHTIKLIKHTLLGVDTTLTFVRYK